MRQSIQYHNCVDFKYQCIRKLKTVYS